MRLSRRVLQIVILLHSFWILISPLLIACLHFWTLSHYIQAMSAVMCFKGLSIPSHPLSQFLHPYHAHQRRQSQIKGSLVVLWSIWRQLLSQNGNWKTIQHWRVLLVCRYRSLLSISCTIMPAFSIPLMPQLKLANLSCHGGYISLGFLKVLSLQYVVAHPLTLILC